MKFDINNYKGKYAMHCKTEKDFINFCDYLYNNGYDHLVPVCPPALCDCYYGKNVYYFNDGTWSSLEYAKKEAYHILEWEDFMNKGFTKADLKTGDVVLTRGEKVYIVIRELETLVCKTEVHNLDDINDDLTSQSSKSQDIIAVRRPEEKFDCCFWAFDFEKGTLIYERKEVEEMTLEQVCKLLGKEIKIIK